MLTDVLDLISSEWRNRDLISARGATCNTHPVTPPDGIPFPELVRYGVDWLRFTATDISPEEYAALFRFCSENFGCTGEQKRWREGYAGLGIAIEGGIYFKRRKDSVNMDLVLDFPGRALDAVRTSGLSELDLLEFAHRTLERRYVDNGKPVESYTYHGLTCSRIDIACDYFSKSVSPYTLLRALDAGEYTATFQSYLPIHGRRRRGSPIPEPGQGMTIEMGTRGSNRFGRCYDKKGELYVKTGLVIPECTRFEMECLHQGAEKTADVVRELGLGAIPGLWADWLCVRDCSGKHTRIERAPVAKWWEVVTGGAEKIVLGLQRGMASPEKSIRWVDKQVAATLKCMKEFRPGLIDEMIDGADVSQVKRKKWLEFVKAREIAEAEKKRRESQQGGEGEKSGD